MSFWVVFTGTMPSELNFFRFPTIHTSSLLPRLRIQWQATAVFFEAVARNNFFTDCKPSLVITVCQVRLPRRLAKASRTRQVLLIAFFSHSDTKVTIISAYYPFFASRRSPNRSF